MSKDTGIGSAWQSHRVAQQVAVAEADKVRQQVFGQPEPPFSTVQAAWKWVRQQAPGAWDERAAIRQFDAYQAQATTALRSITPPAPWAQVGLTFEIVWLTLGPLMRVPAVTEPLRRLAHAADQLATLTGWEKHEAARFILTGAVPRLQSQVSASITRAGVVRLHLTVFPWQLHPVEWARLRHEVDRSLPRFARQEPMLSTVHRRLLDLIAYLGRPPTSKGRGRVAGRKEYWERLAREWGRAYRQKRSWNTIWKLYTRLPRRIRDEIERGVRR